LIMIQIFSSKRFTHIRSTDLSTSSLPLGRSTLYSLRFSRGFTAIEILVVVAIIALLASVGTIMGFDTIGRASVHSERDLFVSLLTSARARALANVNEKPHGIRIEPSKFIIFERSTYGFADPADREMNRNSFIVSNPATAEVVFSQLSANVSSGAGQYILSDGTQSAVIDINSEGRIDW